MKNIYRHEMHLWNNSYKNHLKTAVLAISAGIIIGYCLLAANSDKVLKFWNSHSELIISKLQKKDFSVLGLFWNNLVASALAILSGRTPFLRLPFFVALFNGAIMGGAIVFATHVFGLSPLQDLVTTLPHGIFEMPAILFTTCLGLYYYSASHEKRISKRRRRESLSSPSKNFLESYSQDSAFNNAGEQVALSFIRIALPLLLIAAFIESTISLRKFNILGL
jgi:uncharacterized membrane protein SpoIIM required for sporulation